MNNRKTNIFYNLSDPDNKFLTFSNYTEYLTGNFLSVNKKLFPSSFICVNIPENNKRSFKNDLIFYYENKLATIRDSFLENNTNVEQNINPLGYLLDLIVFYGGIDSIKFVGDICEQDYNGTYTDIICIIEQYKKFKSYSIVRNEDNDSTIKEVPVDPILHGWDSYYNEENITIGKDTNAIQLSLSLDSTNSNEDCWYGIAKEFVIDNNDQIVENTSNPHYSSRPLYSKISINDNNELDEIEFNCVIPLFDVVDIKVSQFEYKQESEKGVLSTFDNHKQKNIPLGVWITNDPVKLKIDEEMKYSPSWSLMITSQFKPFPYSKSIIEKISNNNKNSFNTFASILAEQANITNMITELNGNIISLAKRLTELERRINESSTISSSYDLVLEKMTNIESNINTKMNNLKTELDQKYEALKWQAAI